MWPIKHVLLSCAGALLLCALCASPAAQAQSGADGIDQARMRADMQRMVDQRRRELLPEYQRRVQAEGRTSADAWLRAEATRLGKRDGEQVRRNHELGRYAQAGREPATAASSARDASIAPAVRRKEAATASPAASRPGTRACARMVTRQRSVPSVSGGPMQMIMVTECVPGPR